MSRCAAIFLFVFLVPGFGQAALTPADHPLFTEDAVHEIYLTFAEANWLEQLQQNFLDPEQPYMSAKFYWDGLLIDSIGVRFKGNSSYWGYPGTKKPLKLDFNEFVPGQEISGLDKLNLNNCFADPSFVREKCAYELCEDLGMATVRTNYAAVYINNIYWGLYLLVEQFDDEFIESRFGAEEDGNLWKGDPHGSLEYYGPDQVSYYNSYELKTNEDLNDWSDLVEMVDVLKNTALVDLPDTLHNVMDINSALAMMAVDVFTVNLDSYVGRSANYYMYHRDLDSRFVFAKWDMNMSFGVYASWGYNITQLQQLPPDWTNPNPNQPRPLVDVLLQIPEYRSVYLGHMRKLRAGAGNPDRLVARMEELRQMIRPYAALDTNMMYTLDDFDRIMTENVQPVSGILIPALEVFVRNRDAYLETQLDAWSPPAGLVINELLAKNNTATTDEFGDHDDWIEISNAGGEDINLLGMGLTDHFEGFADYIFPDTTLAPGEYIVVWADEEPEEGNLHAPFKLDADGEDIYLTDDGVIIDTVTFPATEADISWGRIPDGTGPWRMLANTTPGAPNNENIIPEVINLYINEFMALNNAGLQDETGAFEDWVELYNPGPDSVALGGLYLTDDMNNSTRWVLPDTTVEAGEFLLIWCDSDPEDGPLHTNFKLSASGEEIALYGRLAAGHDLIDSRIFGSQNADISEGRQSDGHLDWVSFAVPTPGFSNNSLSGLPLFGNPLLVLSPNRPNPFNPHTVLQFNLPAEGRARLSIFDARGRLVVCLQDGVMSSGQHEYLWNGRSRTGGSVSSGVYFSKLEFEGQVRVGRLTMVK